VRVWSMADFPGGGDAAAFSSGEERSRACSRWHASASTDEAMSAHLPEGLPLERWFWRILRIRLSKIRQNHRLKGAPLTGGARVVGEDPPWRQSMGKSQVNLPQMPPDSGGICMGVD